MWILHHFSISFTVAEYRVLTKSLVDFDECDMTDADKAMNPQHFVSDPADIRIRIEPEIRNGIPDHCWLTFRRRRSLRSLNAALVVSLLRRLLQLQHHARNSCSSRHESFTTDGKWSWDHGVKFAVWQHPAMERGCIV